MSLTSSRAAPKSQAGKGLLETVRIQVADYKAAFGALPILSLVMDQAPNGEPAAPGPAIANSIFQGAISFAWALVILPLPLESP